MTTRFNDYRFNDGKTPLSADTFNDRFADLDKRLVALEAVQTQLSQAADQLVDLGLQRLLILACSASMTQSSPWWISC